MSENKIRSSKQVKRYKGYAPLKVDNLLFMMMSIIIQLIFLNIIYNYFIFGVYSEHGDSFIIEIVFVILWMMISDLIAHVMATVIRNGFVEVFDYMKRPEKKISRSRRFFQYVIYTVIRSCVYALGWVILLSAMLYPHARLGPVNFSYLIAWLLISIPAKLIAWGMALKINLS